MKWICWTLAGVSAALLHPTALVLAQAPATPVSKVGLINLGTVFTRYEKAKRFKGEIDEAIKPFKKDVESLQQEITGLKKRLDIPMPDPLAEQLKGQLAQRTKALEELQKQARSFVSKQSEGQLVVLWKEIVATTQQHAKAQAFTVILAYGDPQPHEGPEFAFVNRKLQAIEMGAANPLYIHPSFDITDAVVQQLNEAYRKGAPPSAPARPNPTSSSEFDF